MTKIKKNSKNYNNLCKPKRKLKRVKQIILIV